MKKTIAIALGGIALAAAVFAAPILLQNSVNRSSAQEVAAGSSEKITDEISATPPFIVLNGGWITGSNMNQRVLSFPQVLAWSPAQREPLWAAETGFLFGGLVDSQAGRIYVIEQRRAGLEKLQTHIFEPVQVSEQWPLSLTILDQESGEVLSHELLGARPVKSSYNSAFEPVAVHAGMLYLMNYGLKNNLFAYDLVKQELSSQSWSICEHGYPSRDVFLVERQILTLCKDFSTGLKTWVSATSLSDGEQSSLEIPTLGVEEYQTGNGMALAPNNRLYVLDSDAGAIAEIDLETLEVSRTMNYVENFTPHEAGLFERLAGWLTDWLAGSASAKRWSAVTALSPDGRWLAVDGGFGRGGGATRTIWLIDLQTLEVAERLSLPETLAFMAFGETGLLYALLEKAPHHPEIRAIAFDVDSGQQTTLTLAMEGRMRDFLSGR
jgi:hypothetical protein